MAWTIPTTRTSGEKITDSVWNVDLVDNLIFLYNGYLRYACVADVKPNNTAGGAFTSGAWRTRDINTEISDSGNLLTIAANQITLVAGIYNCRISVPAAAVDSHQARLYNITSGAVTLLGTDEYNANGPADSSGRSHIVGQFTIMASTVFEIQHRCTTTQISTVGMGYHVNYGTDCVFTIAEFVKIG